MLVDRKRSTNPIWQLASVFGQLGSWNETTKRVVVDDDGDGAGKKSHPPTVNPSVPRMIQLEAWLVVLLAETHSLERSSRQSL